MLNISQSKIELAINQSIIKQIIKIAKLKLDDLIFTKSNEYMSLQFTFLGGSEG